jgi:hypothetical protein
MSKTAKMISRGEAARPRPNDQDALAGCGSELGHPTFRERSVAEKPFDGMDADRVVQVRAVARCFARVVTHAPVDGRQRIVIEDLEPCVAVLCSLREREPDLDVLTSGTGGVAGGTEVNVLGTLDAQRPRPAFTYEIRGRR